MSLPPNPDAEPARPEDQLPTVVPVEEPATVVPVEVLPPPPRPGFWLAFLWAGVFFAVVNGATLIALVPIMVIAATRAGSVDEFIRGLMTQNAAGSPVPSAELARMLAPAVLIGQVVSILFAWRIIRSFVGKDWKRELAFRPPSPIHLLLILVGMPAFLLLPEAIAALAREAMHALARGGLELPSNNYQQGLNELFREWHWLYGVLGVGLGAGIGEELWCRGFLGRGLVARYGFTGGLILTSCLFGLMHVDPPHVVATACMGMALHYVYFATRSLVAPMVIHALNNSAGFLLIQLAQQYPTFGQQLDSFEQVTLLDKLALFLSCIVLLGAVGWALHRSRVEAFQEEGSGIVRWEPPYPGVAEPPEESGAVLLRQRLSAPALAAVLVGVILFAGSFWWTVR